MCTFKLVVILVLNNTFYEVTLITFFIESSNIESFVPNKPAAVPLFPSAAVVTFKEKSRIFTFRKIHFCIKKIFTFKVLRKEAITRKLLRHDAVQCTKNFENKIATMVPSSLPFVCSARVLIVLAPKGRWFTKNFCGISLWHNFLRKTFRFSFYYHAFLMQNEWVLPAWNGFHEKIQ